MKRFEEAWAHARNINGWLYESEAKLLWDSSEAAIAYQRCQMVEARVPRCLPSILEIGSFKGRSAVMFLDRGADVTLIDPFIMSTSGVTSPSRDSQVESELRANLGTSVYCLLPVTSECAAKILGFTKFDFIYFDGDHSEKGIGQDVKLFLPKLQPGGFAAFHDYRDTDYPAVTKAVDAIDWPVWGRRDSLIVKRRP